jgi:ribosome-binding factor A
MSQQYYKRQKPSQRQLQVGTSIHRIAMESLATDEFLYTKFHSLSFTGVRMGSGLKEATIMFTTRDSNVKKIKGELKKTAPFFRKLVAEQLNLRFTPEINFEYDKAFTQLDLLQQNIDKLQGK